MRKVALLVLLFILVFSPAAAAQEEKEKKSDVPELSEVDSLKLELLRKNINIAEQRSKMAQIQLQVARELHRGTMAAFLDRISDYREKYQAPEDRFDFNLETFTFSPKKEKADK